MFELSDGTSRLPSDPRQDAAAYPIVFAVAALLHVAGVGDIARVLVGGTLHEMGHSLAAVLGGRWAFFVPFAFTFTGEDVSPVVVAAVLGGAGWLGWRCVQERCWGWAALCAALIAAQIRMAFIATADDWRMWMVFFGCGGELVLSALMVMAFYHRLPERLRWDFWRWPVLLLGALAFFEAAIFWRNMDPGLSATLGGDSVAQSRENDQDMVRLVRVWHWTALELLRAYRALGLAGAVGILLHYAWFTLAPERSPLPGSY
jgi:hypothetical protein